MGRAINLMISPLPRAKRAKNPRQADAELHEPDVDHEAEEAAEIAPAKPHTAAPAKAKVPVNEQPTAGGLSNPFAGLEIK